MDLTTRNTNTPESPASLLSAALVELTGIEPVTSCLQSRRSPD